MLKKVITGSIKRKEKELDTPSKHQLKIAKQAMRLTCSGCLIMGGPNHHESASIIHHLTGSIVQVDNDCTCKA